MRTLKRLLVSFFVLVGVFTTETQAGIPIPCTGEHLVTVRQTPPFVQIPTRDGKSVHINLGYKFNGCSGGEWVGYSGQGSTYYPLNDQLLQLVLASLELKEPPPAPSFLLTPSASWAAWLWIVLGTLGVIGGGLAEYAKRYGPAAERSGPEAAPSTGDATAVAASPAIPRRVAVSGHAQGPARASFGRRG